MNKFYIGEKCPEMWYGIFHEVLTWYDQNLITKLLATFFWHISLIQDLWLRELAPAAIGSLEAGLMQPRAHLLADPCTKSLKGLFLDCLISSPDARANLFEGLCNMLSSKAESHMWAHYQSRLCQRNSLVESPPRSIIATVKDRESRQWTISQVGVS